MNSKPNQLYIFTIKSDKEWIGYNHQIASRQQIIDNLTFCKEKLPELWENCPEVKNFQYYHTNELASIYFHGEVICTSEISSVTLEQIANYKRGKKK